MRKLLMSVVAVILLLPLTGAAEEGPAVTTNVPFQFSTNGTVLPAGPYEFRVQNMEQTSLQVTDTRTGRSIFVPVLTTISPKSVDNAEVVFDKTDKGYFLSEVYVPGVDGYLIAGATGAHTHVSIKATK